MTDLELNYPEPYFPHNRDSYTHNIIIYNTRFDSVATAATADGYVYFFFIFIFRSHLSVLQSCASPVVGSETFAAVVTST